MCICASPATGSPRRPDPQRRDDLMTTATAPSIDIAAPPGGLRTARAPSLLSAFDALTRRRFALSARTPREILIPLVTPILFADVIAPALAASMPKSAGVDYTSFVAVGTIGLLVPLSCMLGGIGMIVDRESGARRDLLAAPVPRLLLVLGNLSVTV